MFSFAKFGNDLFSGRRSFNIVGRRNLWYTIAAVLLLVSLFGILVKGLNFGIEFRGGTELRVPGVSNMQDYETRAETTLREQAPDLPEVSVTQIGDSTVRLQTGELTVDESNSAITSLADEFGVNPDNVTSSFVGPSWGDTVTTKAIQALVAFLALVTVVLALYFRTWKMALAAMIALLHDVAFTVGIYALLGIEISPASMIGFLTILGYSIYDTIVVFDKVRENTEYALESKRTTYAHAANLAVNQTLVRSINTSVVALLPVAAILFFGVAFIGPGTLLDLSVALFVGMAVGTYSSIFIATPLLVHLRQGEAEVKALDAKIAKRADRVAGKVDYSAPPGMEAIDNNAPPGMEAIDATSRSGGVDLLTEPDEDLPEAPEASGAATKAPTGTTPAPDVHPRARTVHPRARGPRNQPKRPPRSKR
ncbi:protein translocase subunit SecF [Ornithinimicrobium cryptoxanthini]|uniref:Protein-export membrane protein SecF n=1 Tax=Ornithinimicrobium cryptoxanthini TaxID=2934161 RepID=A0ABY4YP04_9MICO|nr:protein translocase subunit SecF [Ornithinimicrobium cryptoxanthini]USQ77877.1 protein translocase subunit SecF [Ornithinimicrobium cryptoxanthini]